MKRILVLGLVVVTMAIVAAGVRMVGANQASQDEGIVSMVSPNTLVLSAEEAAFAASDTITVKE